MKNRKNYLNHKNLIGEIEHYGYVYSINQLAQAANINQAQLSKIENGYSKPSLQSLIKIMLALDMSSICLTEEYANIEYKHRFMNAVKDLKPETIESMLKLIESL